MPQREAAFNYIVVAIKYLQIGKHRLKNKIQPSETIKNIQIVVILTKLGLHLGEGGPNTRDHEPLQHQLYSITEEESWTWPQSRGCLRRPLSGSRRVEIAKGEDSVLVNSTHLLGEPSRSVRQLLTTLTTPPSTNRQTTTELKPL